MRPLPIRILHADSTIGAIKAFFLKGLNQFIGAVLLHPVAVEAEKRPLEGIPPVGGAEDGPSLMGNTADAFALETDNASISQ